MDTTREKASYCIGFETARNLKNQFVDMDLQLLSQGFQDAISGSSPKLNEEEIRSVLAALRQQIEMQQRQFVAKMSEENKKSGEAFLSAAKTRPISNSATS